MGLVLKSAGHRPTGLELKNPPLLYCILHEHQLESFGTECKYAMLSQDSSLVCAGPYAYEAVVSFSDV